MKGTESAQCLRERLQTQIDNKKEEENPPLSFSKTHAHMKTRASTHRDKPEHWHEPNRHDLGNRLKPYKLRRSTSDPK